MARAGKSDPPAGLRSQFNLLMLLRVLHHLAAGFGKTHVGDNALQNSGHGRELGEYGMASFLNVKQVTTYQSKARWDWYPESKL